MFRTPLSLATACLLSLTLLSSPLTATARAQPVEVPAPVGPIAQTIVHGTCHGGGKVVLTVEATTGGYLVSATTHGLIEGTTWRGGIGESSDTDDGADASQDFDVVATDGGWTVAAKVPAFDSPYFTIVAFGPGPIRPDGRYLCSVLARPALPLAAASPCRKSLQLSATAIYRQQIGLVVRWGAFGARPGTTWTITVSAADDHQTTSVVWQLTAGKYGVLLDKTTFADEVNPLLKFTALADGGQRCTMAMRRIAAPPSTEPAPGTAGRASSSAENRPLSLLLAMRRSAVHAQTIPPN